MQIHQNTTFNLIIDDILEIVKKQAAESLLDTTPQFCRCHQEHQVHHRTKRDLQMPFHDTLIMKKLDGHLKLLVYKKTTHTDQYIHFSSHHLLKHKLSVIRTLLDTEIETS